MNATTPSFFNPELWDEEEQKIWEFFDYKCLLCGNNGDVIHEIVPKSRAPKLWILFENRVLLCVGCHELIHRNGAGMFTKILKEAREKWTITKTQLKK